VSNNLYGAIDLVGGGTGALDKIDGADLVDKDGALVITATAAYLYVLDDDSGAAENSPLVIEPNTNAGTKRWILVSLIAAGLDIPGITDGNIPYMAASGFADSPIRISGTIVEIVANNSSSAGGDPLNILRFTDTDTSSAPEQRQGQIEWYTSDTVDGPAGVHSRIYGLTTNTLGLGALVFETGQSGSSSEKVRILNTGVGINTATPDAEFQVVGDCKFGDDDTNYCSVSTTGDMSFTGSAGFYPRFLTQADKPAAGTGATQCDTGEMVVWKDSDDNKIYLCFNDSGTVKTVELT